MVKFVKQSSFEDMVFMNFIFKGWLGEFFLKVEQFWLFSY